ncbi:MAG: nuclear transport factor 2 family protein [Pseudomonadota bacterium]
MGEQDSRITLAENLFKAWSSGDADAPGQYLAEDAVLYDIVGGEHQGWPAIRGFFAGGVEVWKDLALIPDEYWVNERGVALRWIMSATVPDDRFGPENKGKKWQSPGMSYLVIEDGKVVYEADYHDGGAVFNSLGIKRKG